MQGDSEKALFPEHHFLLACLRLGLTIQDLKYLNFVDVMKIFLSIESSQKKQETKSVEHKNVRKATQADIDRLLR